MAEDTAFFSELLSLQEDQQILKYVRFEAQRFTSFRHTRSEELLAKLHILERLVESTKARSPTLSNHLVRIYERLKELDKDTGVYLTHVDQVFRLMYTFTNPRSLLYASISQLLTPEDEEQLRQVMSVKDLLSIRASLATVLDAIHRHTDPGAPSQPLLEDQVVSDSLAVTRKMIENVNNCLEKAAKNPIRGLMRSTTEISFPVSFKPESDGTMTLLLPYLALFLHAITDTFLRIMDEELMRHKSAVFGFVTKEMYLLVGFVFLFIYNCILNRSLSRAILISALMLSCGTAGIAAVLYTGQYRYLALCRGLAATGGPALIARRYLVDVEDNFTRTKASAMYSFAFMLGTAFAYCFLQFVHTSSRLDWLRDVQTYAAVIAVFAILWMVLALLAFIFRKEPQIKHSHLDQSYYVSSWLVLFNIFILSSVYFFIENIAIPKGRTDFGWTLQYGETFLAAFYMTVAPLNLALAIGSHFIRDRRYVLISIWLSAASLAVMVNLQKTSFVLSCLIVLFAYDIIRGPAYSLYSKLEPSNPALRGSVAEVLAFIVAEAMAASERAFETKCYACCGCLLFTLAAHYFEKCWFKAAVRRAKAL